MMSASSNPAHKIPNKVQLSLVNLVKIKLIGAGTSGEVYLVQDKNTKIKMALKSAKLSEDPKTKENLEKEVALNSILKHENIIRCYATFYLNTTINFVLEYMNRGTLNDLLKNTGKIPEKYLGFILYQILNGLAYCQKNKRIVHRDLKPSNILINSKGSVKVSDFGVSATVEGTWVQKKTMIGTYKYMGPERIANDVYYINCDIWSLGIIAMECGLGYFPYNVYNNGKEPDNVFTLLDLIENKPIPTLDEKIFSKELIDFANACLIKDPKKRPTAADLLAHPLIQKHCVYPKNDFANWVNSIHNQNKS